MATIQNYRDQQLQATDPRLIHVPSNTITLSGTGNTFEVRGANTHPSTIIITAIPVGHLINQIVTFSLVATTGHLLSIPYDNTAIITGDVNGSDIITVKAEVTYQGLTYESTYTINKIAGSITLYEATTSAGSVNYDPNTDTYSPTAATGITVNAVQSTDNGVTYIPYSGRFSIDLSTNGGYTWGTSQYIGSNNESSYLYNLTGVNSTINRIRFRLHTKDETVSDSNVLDTTIIPIITNGFTGSGRGGIFGRSVNLYIGSASPISIYDSGGYLASSYNIPPNTPVLVWAETIGFAGSQWYRWLLDESVVSNWGTTNTTYTYLRNYYAASNPDILRIEVGDGYSGSNPYAQDILIFSYAQSNSGNVITGLSNPLHTIPIDISGTSIYTNSGTSFWVYESATALTFNAVSNTYPTESGKYNIEVTYTNISSGGSITGMGTTTGVIPNHKSLTDIQATVTITFRVRKLNGNTISELYEYQTILKSSYEGNTVVVPGDNTSFYSASNLPYVVDFTDLVQEFWPGYSSSFIYSGSMAFSKYFSGQFLTTNAIGNEQFEVITGIPSTPLTLSAYAGSNTTIGAACDPMDHPVIFGIFSN